MMRLRTPLAILTAALLLTWPALLNRYPLLFPDTIGYIQDGRPIAAALFLHRHGINAMRSEFYSLGIFPFHWNLTPWPVVFLQALLTSFVLYLTVRSILPHRTTRFFLAITAGLSLFTSASWFVSLVMPDILGALLYLAIYLLVFADDTLSHSERVALCVIGFWAVTAHTTHLMLAIGLCLLLALLFLVRWPPIVSRGRSMTRLACLLVLAILAQIALHAWLYGHPSVNGNHPPYLMARIIADGPGALYLKRRCAVPSSPAPAWAICADVNRLPNNDDDFLWQTGGVWSGADKATQQLLLDEEMPLVLATLRAYPGQQAAVSFANFTHQLNDFGVNDFDNNGWMESALERALPGSQTSYARTLQIRSAVPSNPFTLLQRWIVIPMVLLLAALVPSLVHHRRQRMLGLVVIVFPAVLANAFITAVLSSSDSRYQARVIWLIPLVACLALVDKLRTRHPAFVGS